MSRRGDSNESSVSLFPFLAVLVCTMGSLILLLLVTTKRIHDQAVAAAIASVRQSVASVDPSDARSSTTATAQTVDDPQLGLTPTPRAPLDDTASSTIAQAPEPSAPQTVSPPEPVAAPVVAQPLLRGPDPAALARRREQEAEQLELNAMWQAKVEQLSLSREQEERKLFHGRLKAKAISLEVDQLNEELARLEAELQQLPAAAAGNPQATNHAKSEELSARIQGLRKKIVDLEEQPRKAESKFMVVPFDVQAGTTRRPILIECTANGLRFLPEDRLLTAADLEGFNEKYNPLQAGAAALVSYWTLANQRQAKPDEEPQPYVLLLVRPSGTIAYYAAMKYLSSLRQPFGYELIEEALPLHVPLPDDGAKAALNRAVDSLLEERERIARSIQADRGGDQLARGNGRGSGKRESPGGSGRGSGNSRGGTGDPDDAADGGRTNRRGFDLETPRPLDPRQVDSPGSLAGGSGDRNGSSNADGSFSGLKGDSPTRRGGGSSSSEDTFADVLPSDRDESTSSAGGPGGLRSASSSKRTGGRPGSGDDLTRDAPSEDSELSSEAFRGDDHPASGSTGSRSDRSGGRRPSSQRRGSSTEANEIADEDATRTDEPTDDGQAQAAGRKRRRDPTAPDPSWDASQKQLERDDFGRLLTESGSTGDEVPVPEDHLPEQPFPTLGERERPFRGSGEIPLENLNRRRWGSCEPGASIGLEHDVKVKLSGERLLIGDRRVIRLGKGESRSERIQALLVAIDEQANTWGMPPKGFFWVPRVKFQIEDGGDRYVEGFIAALKKAGLTASQSYAADQKESRSKSDRRSR